jgi:flagellar hook-associated protein 2
VLQNQQAQLQAQQAAYNTVSAQLLNLQAAASALDQTNSFNLVTANSSDTSVATVTAQAGAQTGSHSITVTTLAQTQTITSTQQSSQTNPLGYSGQIVINGKAINVQSSDSLQILASDINAAQAGVTASIIAPSSNQYYLTIASNNSGLQGQISISDTSGGSFLGTTLGLFNSGGSTSLRHAISTTGAGSDLFSDSITSIGTLEGQSAPASGTVTIGSGTVNIDLATDSLTSIASKINAANITGVTAQVVTTTDPISGTNKQQLQINGTQTFVDSNNVLANLGVIQHKYAAGRQTVAAQDASFSIDGLSATSPTNTLTNVISGVTINLLQDGGAKANLTISSDTNTIATNISSFVTAFNNAVNSIASQSTYDSTTGATGTLFGDPIAQGIQNDLVYNVTSAISGLPSSMSLLSQIGITLDQSDNLEVNSATLNQALSTNLSGVANLFQAVAVASNPQVQFVSSSSQTQPSGSAGYAVNVTQPATQATIIAPTVQTQPLAQDETLTFGGPLFGTSSTSLTGGHTITLTAGSTLANVITEINNDPVLSAAISASTDPVSGALELTAKQFGSTAEFAVESAIPAASNSSGIGTTIIDQKGQDVQGTINGETATGSGQFLTDTDATGSAQGLQLRVTASSPGSYGTVTFTSGVADILKNYATTETDPVTGSITNAVSNIQTQISDIQTNISQIEQEVQAEQTLLQTEFTNMETSVAQLKAASAGLAQLTSTSSSSSTG